MAEDDETPWHRSLFVGLGALLGVAALVGGVISVIALGAVSLTGLDDSEAATEAEPSLYFPEPSDEPDAEDDDPGLTLDDLNPGRSPSAQSSSSAPRNPKASRDEPKKRKRKPPRSVISLSASPLQVAPMERIYLSGTYPGGEGASLQVQRKQGSWTDFPTSTSVSGGTFSTYVMTGQGGINRFRVVDPATGKKSNVVRVRVG